MAIDFELINNFTVPIRGITYEGKQGTSTDGFSKAFSFTIDGNIHCVTHSLATATVVTVWDDDNDVPIDWDYLYFWADVDMYIQLIGSGSNVIFKCLAKVPFTRSYDTLLAAADTTIISGGTEPTLTDIDSVVIGNYSGGTGNYLFAVVD